MFRTALRNGYTAVQTLVRSQSRIPALGTIQARTMMEAGGRDLQELADQEFDAIVIETLNDPEIDGWQVREIITAAVSRDAVPEPDVIKAALYACRRLNDYALATRFLEASERKCGRKHNEIWPWVAQEIQPTLDELGIYTIKQMGYDKPELECPDVFEMH